MRSGPRPLKVISEIKEFNEDVSLTQVYTEPGIEGIPGSKHYCASAIILSVRGDDVKDKIIEIKDERIIELNINGASEYDIFLSSAATLDEGQDIVALALAFKGKSFQKVILFFTGKPGKMVWSEFWERSYICLRSENGKAEYLERGLGRMDVFDGLFFKELVCSTLECFIMEGKKVIGK